MPAVDVLPDDERNRYPATTAQAIAAIDLYIPTASYDSPNHWVSQA
jgi:hypothetical protein